VPERARDAVTLVPVQAPRGRPRPGLEQSMKRTHARMVCQHSIHRQLSCTRNECV
jgi:hypothetical protein